MSDLSDLSDLKDFIHGYVKGADSEEDREDTVSIKEELIPEVIETDEKVLLEDFNRAVDELVRDGHIFVPVQGKLARA